jgi:magnesium transporter
MSRMLITTKGSYIEPSKGGLSSHLKQAEREGFWLDIEAPDEDDYEVLEKIFGFHPLTIEDVKHLSQRPKLEEYTGYSFMVVFGTDWSNDRLTFLEHDIYLGPHYIVTVHQQPAPVLTEVRNRIRQSPEVTKDEPAFLTYLVIDAIVDCNFPTLATLDDVIDQLQDDIIERADPKILSTIYGLKHDITELRRYLSAQRDLFQQMVTHSLDLHHHDLMVYWRDVHDHILRQYETVDSLRDLLTGAMDVYLSSVSNRLNQTMKTLTIVASLFLPLTWLTGFYGMNFAYLTGVLEPQYWAFWVGIATMIGALAIQVVMFRRRGWL